MTIESELDAELKDALRARDRDRLDVIRQIRTEVAKAGAEPGAGDEDSDTVHGRVIAAYVKKMDKARREYDTLGERGVAMSAKLTFETDYLSRWIPESASSEDLAGLVAEAIAATGASQPAQAGQVIGTIMKNHQGLDGAAVNAAVRAALEG